MKDIKLSIAACVTTLVLCIGLLAGTTYAWFSASSVSEDNVVEVGSLEISVKLLGQGGNYAAIPTTPIFSRDDWEPGQTDFAVFELTNTGTLAMDYDLRLRPHSDAAPLTNALYGNVKVYGWLSDTAITAIPTATDEANFIGYLSDILSDEHGVVIKDLNIASEAVKYVTLALALPAELGDEYQDIDGDDFDISICAAQYDEKEEDPAAGGN